MSCLYIASVVANFKPGTYDSGRLSMTSSSKNDASEFLTIAEIARMLQLHPSTIWRHIRSGQIKAVKIGRSYRIRRAELNATLAAAEVMARACLPETSGEISA